MRRARTTRILLATPYPLVGEGIVAMLASEENLLLLGETRDSDAALQLCREQQPDLLLLD